MSGNRRYFLDTNALVALGNGEQRIGMLVADAEYLATSVVCKLEYLSWPSLPEAVRARFMAFLPQIDILGVDADNNMLHEQVVSFRRLRHGIKLPDAIIMASAKVTNSVLVTQDRQVLNAKLCETISF